MKKKYTGNAVHQEARGVNLWSFTLVEILIVIMIFVIFMPVIFNIIYIILQQQLRIHRFTNLKKQGDYAHAFIKENILRDVEGVEDGDGNAQCTLPGGAYSNISGAFIMQIGDGEIISFEQSANSIQFVVLSGTSTDLTDATTTIDNFEIECFKKTADSYPIIGFQFDISTAGTAPTTQEDISLHYQTRVRLRQKPNP